MFVTTSAMRLNMASAMFPDLHVWDLMELELAIPILVVSMSQGRKSSRSHQRRTFFAKAQHLEQFLAVDKASVERVDLFSPGHMNGSDSWKLEPLLELWRCAEPDHPDMNTWLFKVPSGTYADSCLGTAAQRLQREACVYPTVLCARPIPRKFHRRSNPWPDGSSEK